MRKSYGFFVIARINGRYRQIGNGWSYDVYPLERSSQMLKIFEDPTNHLPIQQELIAARGLEERLWSDSDSDSRDINRGQFVRFPFITTCMLSGASFDVGGSYSAFEIDPPHTPYEIGSEDGEYLVSEHQSDD